MLSYRLQSTFFQKYNQCLFDTKFAVYFILRYILVQIFEFGDEFHNSHFLFNLFEYDKQLTKEQSMNPQTFPPIFDGHNDTLLSLIKEKRGKGRNFFEESEVGHIDLPRAKKGGLGGGFFAMFTPNKKKTRPYADPTKGIGGKGKKYKVPLPPKLKHSYALQFTNSMIAKLFKIVDEANGQVEIVTSAQRLEACLGEERFAVIMHIEGAETIDTDLDALYVLHGAGLRSVGLVWSRPNKFAYGVPFSFPAKPDTGKGLTKAGKRLVKACNQLKIMIDLSHLNEKGFWDVAKLSDATFSCNSFECT